MDIVLIAGLWLESTVWDEVVAALATQGHRGVPVSLPGQGDGDVAATLEEQTEVVLAAVDACEEPPLAVGHSAAASLAWIAADRRAEGIAGTALIGGFPEVDGAEYAPFFPCVDGVMAFPGWEPFEGADSADLDADAKARIAAAAIPVPEAVATGTVRLTNPARQQVPVTVVCPEFTPEQAMEWIDAGEVPELAEVERLRLVDIVSGHWPMITRPTELAAILADVANDLSEGADDDWDEDDEHDDE